MAWRSCPEPQGSAQDSLMKSLVLCLMAAALFLGGCSAEAFREMEHKGGPFDYDIDSARAYLLEQLEEKYGIPFAVVGEETLENYGPLAGATYTCEAAPVDAPERVTTALVSQTKYQKVRDNYALYFFKEDAEAQAIDLCENAESIRSYGVALKLPQTPRTWSPEDDLDDFLQTSGAYLDIKIYLEEGKSDEEYIDLILPLLEAVYQLPANSRLSVLEAEKKYLYWAPVSVFGEEPPQLPTKEKMLEEMEIARMM